jgi:TRAP-type C4-dicarboxylate transport system permease small subunit
MTFPPESTAYPEASQASTALVLSIIGLVCCQVLGIVAWVMANNELEGIKSGTRNPTNEGTANAARIIGIVGTVLLALGILMVLLVVGGLMVVPFTEDFFR